MLISSCPLMPTISFRRLSGAWSTSICAVAVSAATAEGLELLREAVIEMLTKDFAEVEVETGAGNGRVLAYLAAHAEIYRQEFQDSRVMLRCFLPRYLVHHIQEPDVHIRLVEKDEG